MHRVTRTALAALIFVLGSIATAAPVRFNFLGQVTDDAIGGCSAVVACGAVSGSYEFDSLAVDGNAADTSAGLYSASAISFSVDGTLFFSAAAGVINVTQGLLEDFYGVLSDAGTASNGSDAVLSIELRDVTASAFGSDALPLTPNLLATLLPGSFTLFASDDSFQLMGEISSVTCDSGCGGGEVPEPATLALFAIAFAGLAATRRRPQRFG